MQAIKAPTESADLGARQPLGGGEGSAHRSTRRTRHALVAPLTLKARHTLGKYRIERRLSVGGFAAIYQALDTVEGIRVALKIPHPHVLTQEALEDFRREVRLSARLDHPHILPLKNAGLIDGLFVIVFALGEQSLADRLLSRLSLRTALDYSEQVLEAVAHAHRHRVIHCDIKPENLILFPNNRLRLADFGLARLAMRTVRASGSGTVGYLAPEQAMGRPSFRSDVFSLGLLMYRLLSGVLPEWPFEWPPPGCEKLRQKLHKDMIRLLRRAIEVSPRRRYQDALHMLAAFRRIKPRALRFAGAMLRRTTGGSRGEQRDWRTVRRRQFVRQFARLLAAHHACERCQGPVAESMTACPWCGKSRLVHSGQTTRFPQECPRCRRGLKLDWLYCPWCYGPGFAPRGKRAYSDARYQARCPNPRCTRRLLMPFMRYCPWCRRKVRRKWKIGESSERCSACGWGVLPQFWSFCPWCGKPLAEKPRR